MPQGNDFTMKGLHPWEITNFARTAAIKKLGDCLFEHRLSDCYFKK